MPEFRAAEWTTLTDDDGTKVDALVIRKNEQGNYDLLRLDPQIGQLSGVYDVAEDRLS